MKTKYLISDGIRMQNAGHDSMTGQIVTLYPLGFTFRFAMRLKPTALSHFTAVMSTNVTLCSGLYVYKSTHDEERRRSTKSSL